MNPMFLEQIQAVMAMIIFGIGLVTFIIGAIILLQSVFGKEGAAILAQTNRLAQKGLAEEVAGLVGNASNLLTAMNDMVRSRNGIGIVMMLIGGGLMVIGFYLTQILH